ncbi:putative cytosolic iron-sulfur protein assembly protein Ciao1 [Diplonema papillatum]|nr:putative cytosolic iron-sulfur protein assembly protein Ciao1 [Diplonema papillatum]
MDEDHSEKQKQGEYFDCLAVLSGHTQDVKHVLWHPDRPLLVSCSYDDTIKVWQEDPGEKDEWTCTQTLKGHTSTVWQACFSKDGSFMASCSDDCTVIVWRLAAGKDGCTFAKECTIVGQHTRTIFGVDWSAGGLIATASADDAVRVFKRRPDGPSGEIGYDLLAHKEHAHLADVNGVKWDPQSDLLASCSDDGTVKLWKLIEEL